MNIEEIKREYGIDIDTNPNNEKVDAIILAVAHDEYKAISIQEYKKMLKENCDLIFDIKQIVDKEEAKKENINLWRL